MEDIVSITAYFTDRVHLPVIQQVRNDYFDPRTAPASTSIMVAGLGHADFLVELAPVAMVPDERFRPPG
jgi:enamine deaminase RidA (YjgF/YER057c/UK114 family)